MNVSGNHKDYQDKIALVTGGTKGIGKSIAMKLAEGGANVVVNYLRSRNAANETLEQLHSFGGDHHAIRCNIGNHEKMPKVYEEIQEKYGRLDILVSNAALGLFTSAMELNEKA